MFSLMDSFLPRSSRRPSPFLLQDAHPPSVHRSLHLQTPAAASLVPGTTQHLTPAQPKKIKKKIFKKSNTYIHTSTYIDMNTQARLKSSHLPPRSTNLLYRCTADFSTWLEQTLRDSEERDLTPPQNNKRKRIKLNSCIREIRVCLHTEFMLGITGL